MYIFKTNKNNDLELHTFDTLFAQHKICIILKGAEVSFAF